MGRFKDLKRRGVETFLQAVGASETTVDTVYTEEYEKFNVMVDDLNEIGAGLSEYLISLKQNYALGNDLAAVMDSYYNGELNRPWISSNPNLSHLSMHDEVARMKQAWEENDEIVRKSVAHVWINRGLTPMRAFVNTVTPDIEEACALRENYRKDADSYRRRYLTAEKRERGAATPEKKVEANQEKAKLNVKLENANKLYEAQNTLVKGELEKAKIARDEAIEMMVVTVAACQMELFEQCYKRLVSACSNFPAEKMRQVRADVQNQIRAGGPNPNMGPKTLSHKVGKAANIVTGKKGMEDYKREKEAKNLKNQAALDRARQVAMEDERRRAAGLNGPPSPPKSSAKGPPLPPKRFSNPTVTPPSAVSSAPKAKAPPPVPVRGGGGGVVTSRAVAFNRPAAAPAPAPASYRQPPPALPKKFAPPAPPKRASMVPTCSALFDNVPDDGDELAFKVGDRIEILKKDDSGWWEGRLRGKKGIFPSNFVKEG